MDRGLPATDGRDEERSTSLGVSAQTAQRQKDTREIAGDEVVLLVMCIDHETLFSQGLPHQLQIVNPLSFLHHMGLSAEAYIVYFASVLFLRLGPGDISEGRKEKLQYAIYGIRRWVLPEPGIAHGDVVSDKVFDRDVVRSLNAPSQVRLSDLLFAGRREPR